MPSATGQQLLPHNKPVGGNAADSYIIFIVAIGSIKYPKQVRKKTRLFLIRILGIEGATWNPPTYNGVD